MAEDIDKVLEALDQARGGLNDARNAGGEWQRGKVSGIDYTATQNQALRDTFLAGLQQGKDGIAAVEAELGN